MSKWSSKNRTEDNGRPNRLAEDEVRSNRLAGTIW